jgi:HEAT repeat protein
MRSRTSTKYWGIGLALVASCALATEPTVATLVRMLQAPDAEHRVQAARGLERLGVRAKAASPALKTALADADCNVRVHAVAALWAIDTNARDLAPVLARVLDTCETADRDEAARLLSVIGKEGAVATRSLVGALDDPDRGVRWMAVEALRGIGAGATEAAPRLRHVVQHDESEIVRARARYALYAVEPETGVPALAGLASDGDVEACQILAEIGPSARAQGVPAIIKGIRTFDYPACTGSVEMGVLVGRAIAITALGSLAGPEVRPFLSKIAANPKECPGPRTAARRALKNLGKLPQTPHPVTNR